MRNWLGPPSLRFFIQRMSKQDRGADDEQAQPPLGGGHLLGLRAPDAVQLLPNPVDVDRLAALLALDLLGQVGLPIARRGIAGRAWIIGVSHRRQYNAAVGATPRAPSAAIVCSTRAARSGWVSPSPSSRLPSSDVEVRFAEPR